MSQTSVVSKGELQMLVAAPLEKLSATTKDNWLYKCLLHSSANVFRRITHCLSLKFSLFHNHSLLPNVCLGKANVWIFGAKAVYELWVTFSYSDILLLNSWIFISYSQEKKMVARGWLGLEGLCWEVLIPKGTHDQYLWAMLLLVVLITSLWRG